MKNENSKNFSLIPVTLISYLLTFILKEIVEFYYLPSRVFLLVSFLVCYTPFFFLRKLKPYKIELLVNLLFIISFILYLVFFGRAAIYLNKVIEIFVLILSLSFILQFTRINHYIFLLAAAFLSLLFFMQILQVDFYILITITLIITGVTITSMLYSEFDKLKNIIFSYLLGIVSIAFFVVVDIYILK